MPLITIKIIPTLSLPLTASLTPWVLLLMDCGEARMGEVSNQMCFGFRIKLYDIVNKF